MRGASQPCLMRSDDGKIYVVKFQNNPQHIRVLANEMLAARLGCLMGLPVPDPAVVEVPAELVAGNPDLEFQVGSRRIPATPGLQFGSRFPGDPGQTLVVDFLPDRLLRRVRKLAELFLGAYVFDKWTCNCDSRQSVFHARAGDAGKYVATMVDQGFCFNASEWSFPDSPLRGLYSRQAVYGGVAGMDSFEPYLGRLENLETGFLEEAAEAVPPEWYEGDTEELGRLVNELADRRGRVAEMILQCRFSAPQSFPKWRWDA